MAHSQPMSMEAMLDEERKEILALLEGSQPSRGFGSGSPVGLRSPSPYATPRSPIRSMLDDRPSSRKSPPRPVVPVRSMLDVDSPPPPATITPIVVRSMLDVDTPLPSNPSSPVDSNFRAQLANHADQIKSPSDSSSIISEHNPRQPARQDPTSGYQFSSIITSHIAGNQALPKRNTQAGKKLGGVMSDVMRGGDVNHIVLPGDRGRHHSIAGPTMRLGNKSKSPSSRLSMRSSSPHIASASSRPSNPYNLAMLDDGQVIDIKNAYRKLSDANLAFSGGSLSQLATRKRSGQKGVEESGRLAKDYLSPDGEVLDDSSEDEAHTSSDEDAERERGRNKAPRAVDSTATTDEVGPASPGSDASSAGRKTLSLLAAAEEERKLLGLPCHSLLLSAHETALD
jgi:hypothetical protein